MQKLAKLKLPIILRVVIVAYLIMSISMFLSSDIERNYYNIRAISLTELWVQVLMVIVISGIFLIFYKKLKEKFLSLLIGLFLLLFLVLFVINSPTFSLMIGASFVAIPPFIFSLNALNKRDKYESRNNLVISIVNILLFIFIALFTVFSRDILYIPFNGLNLSNISDEIMLYENRAGFLIGSILVMVSLLGVYIFANKNLPLKPKNRKILNIVIYSVVGLLLAYQVTYLSMLMVYRVSTIFAPTFDFGLIVQMFYNMKNLNGMVTTLERSIELSHLSVHMSPIYYLMLPVFIVFPHPETLQVLQILVVAVGVIPLYLIAKEFKLSTFIIAIVLLMYIFNPAIIASSFYDLHENCFLAPLLLFVVYFMIKQKTIPLIVSIILTLLIKEDASIYLICIGLYFLLGHGNRLSNDQQKIRNIKYSIVLISLSVLYFVVITQYLNTSGDGAMFWRYTNLNAYPEMNSIGIIISLFQNPSYLLATMFSPDKVYHLMISLFMLGLIPLFSKRITDYILLIPLIIFNFSTTYQYQNQFGFQYYYGTTVLLLVMVLLVLKDRTIQEHKILNKAYLKIPIYVIAIAALTVYGALWLNTRSFNIANHQAFEERDDIMREFLVNIPSDKKIVASGYLTTYLANREVLYDIQFYDLGNTDIVFDYVIIDKRIAVETQELFQFEATSNGYELSDLSSEYMIVLVPIS